MHWALWLAILAFALFLLTNYGAPWLVRRLSSNVRIRNIGLRSVRGLFLKIGPVTLTADRIALTVHRSPGGARVGLDFLNVVVTVSKVLKSATPPKRDHWRTLRQNYKREFSIASIASIIHQRSSISQLSFPRWVAHQTAVAFRTVFRFLATFGLVVLIRWLPALTQKFDTQFDQVVVIIEDLGGAHLVVKGLTLAALLRFTNLAEHDTDDGLEAAHERKSAMRMPPQAAGWSRKWKDSMGRVWDRATARTTGFASLTIDVGDIIAYPSKATPTKIASYRSNTSPTNFNFTSTGVADFTSIEKALPPGSCLSVEGPIELQASVGFSPKRMVFRKRSGEAKINLPCVQVMPDVILQLVQRLKPSGGSPADKAPSPPAPDGSGSAWGPITFSPPGSPDLGPQITVSRWSRLRRRKDTVPLPQTLFAILKGIEINVPEVHARFNGIKEIDSPETYYSIKNQGFLVRLQLSEPSTSVLHQKWLGNSPPAGSKHEVNVYSITVQSRCLVARRLGPDSANLLTLARVGEVSLETVVTGWPAPWLMPPQIFGADPNAAFVAVEAIVDNLELAERIEVVKWLLQHRPPSSKQKPSSGPIIHPVPRINVRFALNQPSLRLIEQTKDATTFITTRTDGFNLELESAYSHRNGDPDPSHCDGTPVMMEYIGTARLAAVTLSPHESSSRPTLNRQMSSLSVLSSDSIQVNSPPPLVAIGPVDVTLKGTAFGWHKENGASGVALDRSTVLSDVRVLFDSLLVDLTRLQWLPLVIRVLAASGEPKPKAHDPRPRKAPLDQLPCGLSVHLSLPTVRVGIVGQGVSLENDIVTSRGLALQSCVTMDYCFFSCPDHTSRLRSKTAKAAMRDRLGLPQEPVHAASSLAQDAHNNNGKAAFAQLLVTQTTVRSVIDDNTFGWLDADSQDGPFTAGEDVDAHLLLRVPEITGKLDLKRGQVMEPSVGLADSCRGVLRVPRISCRFDLHHVYCALAVLGVVKKLMPPRKTTDSQSFPLQRAPLPTPASEMAVSIEVHADVFQVVAVLPRSAKLFLRLTGLVATQKPTKERSVRFITGCLWTPSREVLQGENQKWDEICRLTSWNGSVTQTENLDSPRPSLSITLVGNGARLRIPYRFILSELITNITLAIKASKHLAHTVLSGVFYPMEKPPIEEAKKVPSINIMIDSLAVEIADDPFEAKLNLIWRQGVEEQVERLQRDEAFSAKVAAIQAAEAETLADSSSSTGLKEPTPTSHTVGIEEARARLLLYNSLHWISRHKQSRDALIGREETISSRIREPSSRKHLHAALPFDVRPYDRWPPILRAALGQVRLSLEEPPFKDKSLPDFMFEQGGLPRDTQFTLLVPLLLQWSMDSFKVTLRDYPIPLLEVPYGPSAWTCSSTLIVAEEHGPDSSIDWVECRVKSPYGVNDPAPIAFLVPKTIMPVKSYANPDIRINGAGVTDLAWAVSYTPGIQDVMRVFDTFSAAPRDKSPSLGFWDKLRLIMHWKVRVRIEGETRLHIKGSRDPYYVDGAGAGFVLCFKGDTDITVGYSSKDKELIQISSSKMYLAIPDLSRFKESVAGSRLSTSRKLVKICAKFTNGVRLGFGFALERTCLSDCPGCGGAPAFLKQCRFFTFKPHYEVALKVPPKNRGPIEDSFEGFRSNFIHFSISLVSPAQPESVPDYDSGPNSFHLSPKAFAHFFAWWSLFGATLNLPIRQGKLYPDARPPSPKFGRHIATIKYRISFAPLFISHMYKQDAVEQWREGETGFVGVKAMVQSLRADLHQREQEIIVLDKFSGLPKTTTHKPFAAAEVVITQMELRAVYAIFADPRKSLVPLFQSGSLGGGHASYVFPENRCEALGSSMWMDLEDFNEIDWTPFDDAPRVWMFQAATCPQFTFFRTIPSQTNVISERLDGAIEKSKFGDEDTHICSMSKRGTLRHVQISLTKDRLQALHEQLQKVHEQTSTQSYDSSTDQHAEPSDKATQLKQSIERLQAHLDDMLAQGASVPASSTSTSFCREGHAPIHQSTITTPSDWEGFNNVYEVHSPQIIFSNSTRNILLDYYYSSRNRRGFEYHMSHRALKALKGQLLGEVQRAVATIRPGSNVAGAAARAATALRRILTADSGNEEHVHSDTEETASRITQEKSHFCVLLKPQIALHNEEEEDAVIHIAAMEASLTSHTLIDPDYIDDAVNGYDFPFNRHKIKLHGMQAFVPTVLRPDSELCGVPLEILVDFRCESGDYERLVPQTDAEFSYDKFNRLRLHNEFSNASRQSVETNSSDEYMRNQTDRITIKIPRFTVTANSNSFRAINNIITHLILYSDPSHSRRNEALEKFLFTYDFTDVSSSVDVVLTMQNRIRQLLQTARLVDLNYGSLDEMGQMDALKVQAELTSLGDKLDFIFEAIRLAQEKARNLDNNLSSALQLQVSSDLISYNMLGPSSNLIAKLAVKGVGFQWTNRKDSSTSSVLTIKDFQAFNGLPTATFPEILLALPQPSSHPMVKRKLFAEAKWTVLPPVAQISVIERLELRLHPVKVQIERKIGREIQEYISPKERRAGALATPSLSAKPQAPQVHARDEPPVRRSSDHTASLTVNAPSRTLRMRTSSWVNLRDAERANSATPSITNGASAQPKTLQRSASSHSLRPLGTPLTPTTPTEFGHKAVASETDEMRVRARKRTFWFLLVLTYKGESLGMARREQGGLKARDFIPNLDDFPLTFPGFERHHCTWGFDEFLQVVKSELKKNAVGVVFRAFNARFSNKYRLGDSSRETTIEDQPDQVEGSASVSSDLQAKAKSGPFRIRTLSTPKRSEPRILTEDPINTSPTSTSPPTNSLDSSISSLPSTSETDSRQPRGRTQKVLNLFRHKTKKSTDSASSIATTNSQPRRSLESTSTGFPQRLQPITPMSRSRSVVRD
ncbi:hypothetical protein M407DRAFT_18267 [Tulasnella calospora MUT 4182]|uniref:FMP27 GFWDK domain-containing protein n=1 Tax=Tulasnella calospora MUT 4182 TaxID=1051891 RepID=A0A0C3MGH1_9AGAM|nr:hypothetical protein M407DRAFT_18267 [Tulasnella calospora MUT 4182]